MSNETEMTTVNDGDQTRASDQSIIDQLPGQCVMPGYWKTLAENSKNWAPEISAGPLWQQVKTDMDAWRREYRREHGGELYIGTTLPHFVGKSEDRIREKTFEKIKKASSIKNEITRLFDQSVPIPRLEDLVRVRLQVQFLDGVPFLAKKIHELAGC